MSRRSGGPEFDMVFLLRTLRESPRKGPVKMMQATIPPRRPKKRKK